MSSSSQFSEDLVGGDPVSTSSEIMAVDSNSGSHEPNSEAEAVSSSSISSVVEEASSRDDHKKGNDEDGNNEITSSADSPSPVAKEGVFAQPMLPPPLLATSSRSSQSPSSSSDSKSLSSTSSGRKLDKPTSSSSPSSSKAKEALSREKQEKYNAILSTLKYHPPTNGSQIADPRYNLEVLKNGSIVDSVTFSLEDNKGYYIIGRIPGCDILAENPTVSRLHAILQFVKCPAKDKSDTNEDGSSHVAEEEPQETGLYLFDLKSTHGTFINKNQVFPQKFYRVHVGHVLKFGSSQRMYIVNGPSEDEEEESNKSVTELMNEKLQKDLEKKRIEEEEQLKRTPNSKLPNPNIEEDGINWGMAEDADEESDMRVNPFAMDYESSDLTLDNPKKTLRSWFEREGEDLEFEMKEKGNGQYVCRISLPIDGPTDGPVYAESEVKGKKKEAVHDASMKACQILDSHGLLRASNQGSKKRKERKYEDDDYYSSDDDTFLDRTGSVEKKREKRMRLAGKIENKIETYDSLCTKYSELETEITDLQSSIDKCQKMKARADDGEMDIDDYMNLLKNDAFDVKKLRSRLRQATEELQKTKKLMELTKPAELPSYLQSKKEETSSKAATSSSTTTSASEGSGGLEKPEKSETSLQAKSTVDVSSSSYPETTIASSAQEVKTSFQMKMKTPIGPLKPPAPSFVINRNEKAYGLIMPSSLKPTLRPPDTLPQSAIEELEKDDKEVAENASSSEGEETNEGIGNNDDEGPEFIQQAKTKRKRIRHRNQHKPKENSSSYGSEDPNYSTWVPPSNQSGDGRTSLNEKLGY